MDLKSEVKKLVEENALALVSLNEDGSPHCIAVAFVKVVSKNQILITDNFIVKTTENIARDPRVSLAVWNEDWRKAGANGFELTGHAEYFAHGHWLDEIKKMPENKGMPCKGAILVTIEKIRKLA
ncbi:MAG: pyridoxamine 5'-phosphate oxidase family protein [Candidatus Micrarchaeota archaeon]